MRVIEIMLRLLTAVTSAAILSLIITYVEYDPQYAHQYSFVYLWVQGSVRLAFFYIFLAIPLAYVIEYYVIRKYHVMRKFWVSAVLYGISGFLLGFCFTMIVSDKSLLDIDEVFQIGSWFAIGNLIFYLIHFILRKGIGFLMKTRHK